MKKDWDYILREWYEYTKKIHSLRPTIKKEKEK